MTTLVPPRHWLEVDLQEIAEVRLGRQRSPDRATGPNMVAYLRAANVTWSGLDFADVKEMDFTPREVETYQLRPGDILLAEASGSPGEVGKPGLVVSLDRLMCFQNTLIRVRADEALSPFLHRRFVGDASLGAFGRASKGVGIHHLGSETLSHWRVAVPPLAEQQRIVDALDSYLSRLDAAVRSLERAQAKLKAYRASVLKAAVEGRLVPTEAELARQESRDYEPASVLLRRILAERRKRWEDAELARLTQAGKPPKDDKWKSKYEEPTEPDVSEFPALPEGWCWTSVDHVGDVLLGRRRAPEYVTGKDLKPYLRVANVKDDRIDFDDIEEMDFEPVHLARYRLLPGDILVSEGQSPRKVVQSAVYWGSSLELCFQATLHRFRPIPCGPSSSFAQVVFRAHVRTGVFMAVASITTNIAHLTLEKFRASRFPLPPLAEQRRIETEVARLLSVADATEAQLHRDLTRITKLRQSILKWAFEGRLVDPDPNDEPADQLLARIRAERAANAPGPKKPRGRPGEAKP